MSTTETTSFPSVHHGRNIKRLREMLGCEAGVYCQRAAYDPANNFKTRTKRSH